MKYLLDTCTVCDFVKGLPKVLARIKANPPDLLAVSALTRGLVIVTANVGEFRRVGGLQVEDWR